VKDTGLAFGTMLLRATLQWLSGILFALCLIALFLVANAYQLTEADTAQRILTRAVAAITEIDALLPEIRSDLKETLESGDDPTVTVPLFPVPVELTREEATAISTPELRSRLLDTAAERAYREGWSVFALSDPEAKQDIDPISPEGGVKRGLSFLSDNNHSALRIALFVLGGLSVLMGGLVLLSTKGLGRITAIGACLLGAAVPSLVVAVGIRWGFRSSAEDQNDYLLRQLLSLGNDTAWLPLRNYTILCLLGLGIVMVGLALVLLETRQRTLRSTAGVDNGGGGK
jgi:hypothetical protein